MEGVSADFTHLDEHGAARMVNIGGKPATQRSAVAVGEVRMNPETLRRIQDRAIKKGDVFAAARIAGIMAAKRVDQLIPLCHTLPVESITVDFNAEENPDPRLIITARVTCNAPTGVEMEALTAVAVAALTIYDMCKSLDRGIVIDAVRLVEKSGGQSGHICRRAVDSTI